MFAAVEAKLAPSEDDSRAVKNVKNLLSTDMSIRYQDTGIISLLNKASFLDPRFKTLAHLSVTEQEKTVDNIIQELTSILIESESDKDNYESVIEPEEVEVVETCNSYTSPKKQKTTLLEKQLGKQFEGTTTTVAVSENEIVHVEISHYKSASPISLRDKPLHWWNLHKYVLLKLVKLAQKYLGIVATSVPSEYLFSTAGNIVSSKRAALLPENVDKLVFLHENLKFK